MKNTILYKKKDKKLLLNFFNKHLKELVEAEAKKTAIEKEGLTKAKTIDYIGTTNKNKLEMTKALNAFN